MGLRSLAVRTKGYNWGSSKLGNDLIAKSLDERDLFHYDGPLISSSSKDLCQIWTLLVTVRFLLYTMYNILLQSHSIRKRRPADLSPARRMIHFCSSWYYQRISQVPCPPFPIYLICPIFLSSLILLSTCFFGRPICKAIFLAVVFGVALIISKILCLSRHLPLSVDGEKG